MKMEIPVPEISDLLIEIRNDRGNLFNMIRVNVQESVEVSESSKEPASAVEAWRERELSEETYK